MPLRSHDVSATSCGSMIGRGESIAGGITCKDKGATAERNPLRWHRTFDRPAQTWRIDNHSTVAALDLAESRPLGLRRRAGEPNSDALRSRR
jgi:hypothetical protein